MDQQYPSWANYEIMRDYYENYLGRPVHDEDQLFEMLTFEIFQAGLSWEIVWKKRPAFEAAFDHFQIEKVADFDDAKAADLAQDAGIIRNRMKIAATIANARLLRDWHQQGKSLVDFCWSAVDGQPMSLVLKKGQPLPATHPVADQLSKQMKKLGFKFCGPKVIFSFMTAVGMIKVSEE